MTLTRSNELVANMAFAAVCHPKVVIDMLRARSHSHSYACSMSPPVAQQVIQSLNIIKGGDGTNDGA